MGFFSSIFGKEERSQADIDFENHVRNDGAQYAGKRLADIINEKITTKNLAIQFILEELDAARQGNVFAKNFVKNSGFEPNQYIGAMEKTKWEGDESALEHIQLFYRTFLIKIADIDLMVELSTVIVDNIMKIWKLGKYEETIKVNNENIIAAANAIANDCFSEGVSNPRWMKIYNAALDNMYANALYLGYGVPDGINVNINNPEEANVKKYLNTYDSVQAPKENIEKALLRLLTDKKFNSMEKQVFLG